MRDVVGYLLGLLIIAVWLLDVVGWWVALFLWTIPTLSIPVTEILTMQIWDIVGVLLFFIIWFPCMLFGIVILFWGHD